MTQEDLGLVVKKILSRSRRDENGCLIWEGAKTDRGYGSTRGYGKVRSCHRLVYAYFKGNPGDLYVCHSCDNRACVNKDHLWLGTNDDNMRDMVQKGRAAKGEDHWRVKLNAEDVLNIRRRYTPGSQVHGGNALAEEFGVSQGHISDIVNRKKWRHV